MAGTPGERRLPREKPEQIADELRSQIVGGELSDGDSLGNEPDLVQRFGVSRPSLREALRILEAQGLITVVRGVRGGVIVRQPDERVSARSAAMVLRARNVPLADVLEARAQIEPLSARAIASLRARKRALAELTELVEREREAIADPEAFAEANAAFHQRLVSLAGNQTLTVLAEMLQEIVAPAVASVSRSGDATSSLSVRRRGIRSQERLIALLEDGDGPGAESHWRSHMAVVGKVMLGREASTVVELLPEHA